MTAVANDEACSGCGCDRKEGCLRHAVLRGDVPCFPVADNICGQGSDYAAFVQWNRMGRPMATPGLFQ